MKTITFKTSGHDGFIDFIKAYAILCVLFGHTFLWLDKVAYGVWAGMQVPLFILVQTFHCYKKEKYTINIGRIFGRVMLPFMIVEIITFIIALLLAGSDFNSLIKNALIGFGYGPGAYYPWIYLQVALLLPLFGTLLKKCNRITTLVLFLGICEGFEVLFSLVDFPEHFYRVLCVRYLFLFYLGWLWVKDGVRITWFTILLSVISLAAIIYFEYFSINDEPWFFATKWKIHRWPCYFFVANGFVAVLHRVYVILQRYSIINKCVEQLSKASYEIFLIQMSLIWLFKYTSISFISSNLIKYVIWLFVVWSISIWGGILLNRIFYKNKSSKSSHI